MKYSALLFTLLIILGSIPILGSQSTHNAANISSFTTSADEGLLEGMPYVWQEINGFCGWAATSMALQYIGVDLDLHDIFAASTIGFSMAHVQFDQTMVTFPGALYTQAEPTHFLSELYGVNYTIFLSSELAGVEQIQQAWQSEGLSVSLIENQDAAFDLLRNSIDRGYPLLLSVDPIWLPAVDYNYLRQQGLSGGGHGILVVGYNDTQGTATIVDPGVGSFGDLFGYPDDGRGNYTEITYTALNNAWSNRFYISNLFIPENDAPDTVSDTLGPELRDKLLGEGTAYAATGSNAYIWSYGEKAFRDMSEDISSEGLLEFLSQFSEVENPREFLSSAFVFIGLGLESAITLQYLSYREGLEALPSLMSDVDLTQFIDAATDALAPMEMLSDNSSLIYPGNLSMIDGFLASTFYDMAILHNSSSNTLEDTLSQFSSELTEITGYMLQIADAWLAAGNELKEIWPNDIISVYGGWLLIGGLGIATLAFVTIWVLRKTPSQ